MSMLAVAVAGCQPSTGTTSTSAKDAPKPAKVEGAPKEADLATLTLTPDAETRLGLVTAAAERKAVARTTTYAGEVMIPSGRLTAVTSPFVGTLKGPDGSATPTPGAAVKEGQPVFVLVPILSPESQATMAPLLIESEGQVKQATEQLHIAKLSLDRAENLVKTKAASAAMMVDAQAQYDLAQTNLKAAEARHESLAKVSADSKSGTLKVAISSPASGILQNVHAQVGQTVAAGAALFEVAGLDPVWVKVPVYVGDVSRLAADRPATVGGLADAPGAPGERPARPVIAPPSGDPLAATVNIFYEVKNADGRLRPGERVGVTLPLQGDEQSLTVPRSALIRDIHGGAWVYEKIKPHAYARKRVSVDRVVGDLAVLSAAALKPGASVVTIGAAELYGAEFGGK